MFTSFVKCLTKVSPLVVGRRLRKTSSKPRVLRETNIRPPRRIISATNQFFCRHFTVSNLVKKPEERDFYDDPTKQRLAIYNLKHWKAEDIFIWAMEEDFSDRDARILAENSDHIVHWIRGAVDWPFLKATLSEAKLTDMLFFQNCSAELKERFTKVTKKAPRESFVVLDGRISRDDVAYEYLTKPELMEASINQFKPISPLFGRTTKGFIDERSFFISESRYKKWKEYYDAQNTNTKLRWVPSGPHGIGKSGIGLMIAATAYFLKKPLFYYPNCRSPLTRDKIISTFFYWNKGLFQSNRDMQKAIDILLEDDGHDPSFVEFWIAFTSIPGAVFILDEHNEFYKNREYNPNSVYTSFQQFASAQLVMFIGSAHSKFENNIPDGYQESRFFLQPLNKEEMKHFVTADKSPVAALNWNKIPGATNEEKFDRLYNAFGGVYRQAIALCHALKRIESSFERTSAEVATQYYVRLKQTLLELSNNDAQAHFLTLMKSFQLIGSVSDALNKPALSSIYDRGLVYMTPGGKLTPVNGNAKAAIAFMEANDVEFVLHGSTASENGARLERAFLSSLSLGTKTFSGYLLLPGKNRDLRNLVQVAASHQVLVTGKFPIPNTNWDASTFDAPMLLTPSEENHPYWDAIVKMPQEVFLFQVTVAKSEDTLRKKFNQFNKFLFVSKQNPTPSLTVKQYAKNLYGDEAIVEFDEGGCWISVQKKKIKMNFILVHGTPIAQSKKLLAGIEPRNQAWKYLEILPEEFLTTTFNISF